MTLKTPYPRSDWALTVLSLLNDRPMHPYEMRQVIRQYRREESADLRPGSLYRTIEQLARAALIEPVETSRQGRLPERTVYRITERGRDELEEWLRELLSTPRNDLPRLLLALSVMGNLEPDDARLQLEARVVYLEAQIAALETTTKQLADVLPRLLIIENEYALALRRAELDWARAVVDDLRAGRLTWTLDDLRNRMSQPDKPSSERLHVIKEG